MTHFANHYAEILDAITTLCQAAPFKALNEQYQRERDDALMLDLATLMRESADRKNRRAFRTEAPERPLTVATVEHIEVSTLGDVSPAAYEAAHDETVSTGLSVAAPAWTPVCGIVLLVLLGWCDGLRAQACCVGPCSGLERSCLLPGVRGANAVVGPRAAPAPPQRMPAAPVEEPPLDDDGYDLQTLPARAPGGDWLPLVNDEPASGLYIGVRINGIDVTAELDTGSSSILMGAATAQRLGIVRDDRVVGDVEVHAFDETTRGRVYWAPLNVGSWRVEQASISVIAQDIGVLIGCSILSQFDLYIAPDEGLVGLFQPGQAPAPRDAFHIEMRRDAFDTPVILGGTSGQLPVWFTLDTGAATSVVPAAWVRGRPAVATGLMATIHGQGERARFDIGPLSMGSPAVDVGVTFPSATGASANIGLDVLRRFHTRLSPSRGRLSLGQRPRAPAWRTPGAGGAACTQNKQKTPCISVSLQAGSTTTPPQLCATLGPAAPTGQVALEVTARHADGSAAWGGGWATLYVPAGRGWRTTCHTLRVDEPPWAFDALELVRVRRVRAFPCPGGGACLSRGAPLP